MARFARPACTALLLTLAPAGAFGQTCTPVTTLPATLSSPGVYCLTSNLTYSGTADAIVVSASDVVIDFQQFRLRSTSGNNGVLVNSGDDVVIRNGKIDGFASAIRLSGGRAALVEKMRISQTGNISIVSTANSPIIRENRIDRAGATAIATSGNQVKILDNDITFHENNPYYGIGSDGSHALIQGNRMSQVSVYGITVLGAGNIVRNNVVNGVDNTVTLIGILTPVSGTSSAIVEGNVLRKGALGISAGPSTTGKYRDNVTHEVTTPYDTGGLTNSGNND
jgi:Right handed beta helix region